MSVAENLTVEIPHAPRRPHAAVAALVGGPYPNLVAPARDLTRIDLRHVGEAGLPAGGPYPNLSLARR